MDRPEPTVPRYQPQTLRKYLSLAAEALLPKHNERRMVRILRHLLAQRDRNNGWVERAELEYFWDRSGSLSEEDKRRLSNAMTNSMREFKGHLDILGWSVPNFALALEEHPPKHAERYRLKIERKGPAWDFVGKAAPHTEASEFSYSFESGSKTTVKAQVWHISRKGEKLEIEATRESAHATWAPPNNRAAYRRLRDTDFKKELAKTEVAGARPLFPGELWGIKDVRLTLDDSSTTIHITTTRISYADYRFVRSHYGKIFSALTKNRTFASWLGMDGATADKFCPPHDALCVAVALIIPGKEPSVLLGRQRPVNGFSRWELSAMGAASSTHVVHEESKPDLPQQMHGVVLRETGLKFRSDRIQWLGFARKIKSGESSVIALVELELTSAQVKQRFEGRADRRDLVDLTPIKISALSEWLKGIPALERGELLEIGLALVAHHYGRARIG